ncbi:glycosyltransferase family 39 protein [Sporolactobacillus vineae]|uniref:glycosyltransferase family 39 protein n=1 Tax=Sporolactobacillus vineae TaxID=444463 RepID=UPI000287DE91|nr:glycosyltransferase family 39 protein [Sporolactobacillus vineae]
MGAILKWKHGLLSVFSIVFALCFFAAWAAGFIYPFIQLSDWNLTSAALALALFSIIVLLFFLALYRWMDSLSAAVIRRISLVLMAVMGGFEVWLILAFHTLIPPHVDGGHTYAEALYLLAHHHASGLPYFQIYPNNIPVTLLRYFIYQVFSWVHLSSYMVIDWAFCAAMLDLGIFFGWKLVRKLTDERGGCFFLLFTLTCLPLFFYTLYFYTDTTIIAFPVLLLYCWYQYRQSGKAGYLLLIGLLVGIGYLIRPNLILFLPALIIYMFFVLNWKKVIINSLVISAIVGLISFSAVPVERHYGYVPNPALATPTVHWMALGLSPNGGYNNADMQRTLKQPTQAAKKQTDLQQIRDRLSRYGLTGLTHLAAIKAVRTWSSGAHAYFWYTHLNAKPTTVYEYLLNRRKSLMLLIIQIFYMVNLFLMIFSIVHYFRTRKADLNLLIQICLFGNFLFYTFVWEAEPRYSLLFSTFILISDVYGLKALNDLIARSAAPAGDAVRGRTLRLALAAVLAAAVLVTGIAGYHPLTQTEASQYQYSVDQPYINGKKSARVDPSHVVTQTFRSLGTFNRITVYTNRATGRAVYSVSLTNLHTGKIIFSRDLRISSMKKNQPLSFRVPAVPDVSLPYRLTFTQVAGRPGSVLALQKSGLGYDQRDLYPGGRLLQSGNITKKQDLKFKVYHVDQKPYLSTRIYFSLLTVPLLMLLFYAYISVRRMNPQTTGKKQGAHRLKEQQV